MVDRAFKRVAPIPQRPKGQCRGCAGPIPKGRRSWCGDACVTDALVRKGDAGIVRQLLVKRDSEVCAGCGLDCRAAQRVLDRLTPFRWPPRTRGDVEVVIESRKFLSRHWTGNPLHSTSLWQADHVVPVIEGGGGCGLDGYRTLCVRCHKVETAALARRRATGRT